MHASACDGGRRLARISRTEPCCERPMSGTGMPEAIRDRGASCGARRRAKTCRTPASAALLSLLSTAASAQEAAGPSLASTYLAAFARLEQQEVAALALILGVLFFAVFTAILLVRTRARAAATAAAARER